MILAISEIIAWVATIILAVFWVTDPAGNYEPWTVICGVIAAGAEGYRQFKTRAENTTVSTSEPEELVCWIRNHGT